MNGIQIRVQTFHNCIYGCARSEGHDNTLHTKTPCTAVDSQTTRWRAPDGPAAFAQSPLAAIPITDRSQTPASGRETQPQHQLLRQGAAAVAHYSIKRQMQVSVLSQYAHRRVLVDQDEPRSCWHIVLTVALVSQPPHPKTLCKRDTMHTSHAGPGKPY
jgi:hypothetical protein